MVLPGVVQAHAQPRVDASPLCRAEARQGCVNNYGHSTRDLEKFSLPVCFPPVLTQIKTPDPQQRRES